MSTETEEYKEVADNPKSETQVEIAPQQENLEDNEITGDEVDTLETLPTANDEVQPAPSVESLIEPVQKANYLDARKLLISPDETRELPPPSAKNTRKTKLWRQCTGSCFKRSIYVLASTFLFSIYACGGAYLFSILERQRDVDFNNKVEKWKNDTAILLATELRQVTPYEKTWSKTVFRHLDIFEKDLLKASAMGYKRKDDQNYGQTWTFERAFFFSVSLMTTTGIGSNLARSEWSEAIVMGYAFFGVLLTVTWLIIMGWCMAALWWWMFQSFCCPLCNGDDSAKIYPNQLMLNDKFSDTNTASDFLVTVLFPLLILLLYFVFGAAAMTFIADWTISHSFYFNFVMFLTLGPGCQETGPTASTYDFRQNTYYVIYWLFGLCLMSMFLNLVCLMLRRKNRRRKIRRHVSLHSNGKLHTENKTITSQVQSPN